MKIISGNIRQSLPREVALEDINRAIETCNPDIICLQEATVDTLRDAASGYVGAVATEHGLEPTFAQTRHFHSRSGDIHSGLATLVRAEIANDVETREVELNSQRIHTPFRPIGRRALLITTITEADRSLHVVNAHLSYPGINPLARRREWKKVFEIVNGLEGDVVISGDFNVRPNSQFIQECNRRWRQVTDHTKATFHNLYSFVPKSLKERTIDYVFTNKDFKRKVSVSQLPPNHSDHIWHSIDVS